MAPTTHSRLAKRSRRPSFRPEQVLSAEQLTREQTYHMASLQRALLGLAGPGVVYGFAVTTKDSAKCKPGGCIDIGCGLAFDSYGHQLYWCGGKIGVNDLAGDLPDDKGWYTLRIHYAEHRLGEHHRRCGCDYFEQDWVEEGIVFTLDKNCDEFDWGCPKPKDDCISLDDYICNRLGAGGDIILPAPDLEKTLCKSPGELRAIACDDWFYDPDSYIELACVEIRELTSEPHHRDCKTKFSFCPSEPKVCGYRPFVYRNALLFELIRGCHNDFAQVADLSWQDWLLGQRKTVSWGEFTKRVMASSFDVGFTVTFSKPMRIETLNKASILLSAVTQERGADYWESRRIPLSEFELIEVDDDGCARGVWLRFEQEWLENEIDSSRSTLDDGALIELVIRGSLLRDHCNWMLDARPLDIADDKPGQARPGGDFIAVFQLAARNQSNDQASPRQTSPEVIQQSPVTQEGDRHESA